mmetsp:Transcript_78082/g.216633  ORF Transcript_78082/g.216633 Transcript_78082/m.216633 type:complete len:362 (+) Transcript_78082:2231-3316(+)
MLGDVERLVGRLHQRLGTQIGMGRARRRQADTDRQRRLGRAVGQALRAQLVAQQLQHALGLGHAETRQQRDELLAAQPRDHIRVALETLVEQGRDALQGRIASSRAMGLIELLELVQIQHGQGQQPALTLGTLELAAQRLVEGARIGDARQRIGARQPGELALLGLQRRLRLRQQQLLLCQLATQLAGVLILLPQRIAHPPHRMADTVQLGGEAGRRQVGLGGQRRRYRFQGLAARRQPAQRPQQQGLDQQQLGGTDQQHEQAGARQTGIPRRMPIQAPFDQADDQASEQQHAQAQAQPQRRRPARAGLGRGFGKGFGTHLWRGWRHKLSRASPRSNSGFVWAGPTGLSRAPGPRGISKSP